MPTLSPIRKGRDAVQTEIGGAAPARFPRAPKLF
jgi:hypothetical protein